MSITTAQHDRSPETADSADNRVVSLNTTGSNRDDFLSPDRERLLEALLHSLSIADYVTVVTGVAGSGKSMLIERLRRQVRAGWTACLISARHAPGEKHILEQLARCFSPGRPVDMTALSVVFAETPGHCVVIVDDAHRLTAFALEALFRLKQAVEEQGGQLGLVLFAQPAIRQLLSSPSLQPYDALIRHVDLPALTEEQADAYIDQWLERSGAGDARHLTPMQKHTLYRRSGGIPGKLNRLIEQTVARHGQPQKVSGQAGSRGRSLSIRITTGTIATVFAIAGIVWFMALDDRRVTTDMLTPEPAASNDGGSVNATRNAVAQARPGEQVPVTDDTETVSVATDAAPLQATTETKPVIDKKDRQALPADQEVPSTDSATPVSRSDVIAEEPASPMKTPPTTVSTTPVTAQEEASTVTDSNEAQAKPTTAPVESESAIDGQTWLLAQDGEHYTVQLAASLDRQAIERFVDSQPTLSDLYSAHIKQRGRDWYISVYGAYAGLAEARAAVAGLPLSMRKNSPWIRQLAKIQALVPVSPDDSTADEDEGVTTETERATTASSTAEASAVEADVSSQAAADSEAGAATATSESGNTVDSEAGAATSESGNTADDEESADSIDPGSADPVPPAVIK